MWEVHDRNAPETWAKQLQFNVSSNCLSLQLSLIHASTWESVRISINNSIESNSKRPTELHLSNGSMLKTSKALMRHTILVKHIYCAIYFAFLFLFVYKRFSQIKTFTAKAKNIFFALLFLFVCVFVVAPFRWNFTLELTINALRYILVIEIINLVIFYWDISMVVVVGQSIIEY